MVYVINHRKQPLMPCSPRTARLLLRDGKARVEHRAPFTIRLLDGSAGYRQEIVASLDTGSTVLGCAAVTNGEVIYQSEVTLRNDIASKMDQRRMYRRTRRIRNTRYRPARFNNRSASTRKGRLPPSLKSKLDSHLREIRFVESILPVTRWRFELAAFDIHKIVNPDVAGPGYQEGPQKGYYNTKQYVLHRDGYACQSGQKVKHHHRLHVHHIIYRSNKGPDNPKNLVTLCEDCHDALHAGAFVLNNKGKRSRTKHATEIGILKSRLHQCDVPHEVTYGYETKFKRERLGLPKTHANDAIAACLEEGEAVLPTDAILIKRHIAAGDYQQTTGKRSEKRIPTGKLFGLRKGDKIATSRGIGFIKGKRSTGYFSVANLDGQQIHASEKVQRCVRLSARTTTQTECLSINQLNQRRMKST